MDLVLRLMAGAGIAIPCGLSAYLPLLVLSVAGVGHKTTLYAPFDFLASWPAVAIIALLVGFDLFADKLPGMQRTNNAISQVLRPLAGGLVSAAIISPDLLHPVISFVYGAVLAGIMHLIKSSLRPALASGGSLARLFEPLVSIAEDGLAVVLAVLALVVPIIAAPFALFLLVGAWFWQFGLRRSRKPEQVAPGQAGKA